MAKIARRSARNRIIETTLIVVSATAVIVSLIAIGQENAKASHSHSRVVAVACVQRELTVSWGAPTSAAWGVSYPVGLTNDTAHACYVARTVGFRATSVAFSSPLKFVGPTVNYSAPGRHLIVIPRHGWLRGNLLFINPSAVEHCSPARIQGVALSLPLVRGGANANLIMITATACSTRTNMVFTGFSVA